MSGRSQEISDLTSRYREETGREASGPSWDRYVAARRGAKSTVAAEELVAIWAEEAAQHGLDTATVEQLVGEAMERARHWVEPDEQSWPAHQLRQEILSDLCRDYALVPNRQLDALAQQRAVGLVSPYVARAVVATMLGEGDILRTTEGQVTTLEVLAQEQRAERALGRLVQGQPGPAVDPERLAQEIREAEERERPFDPGQREAIALAVSGARFVSIAGPAGTGKGYASRAMVNLWHDQGRRVFALAVAGRTTQQAAHDSGAEPMTLDALTARSKAPFSEPLLPRWQLRPSDVLLVDEAAMIDHERYANLLETAADAGASIVQVGDDRQLNPVGPGGLWTIFHKFAAQQGTATELREIHRTRDPGQQQAWSDLREGRIEEALTWYRDVGKLRLYDTRPELLQGMVAEWWRHDRAATMIVDSSNAERDSVNRMAQAKRLEAGELGVEVFRLANGREIRTGDRVIFSDHPHPLDLTLNAPGKRVENGTEAIVRDVFAPLPAAGEGSAQSVTLELHEPAGTRTVQVDASAELELAYARHAVKSQGMTVQTTDIALSSQTGQQELYEMASRSREDTRIHALRSEVEAFDVQVQRLEAIRPPESSLQSEIEKLRATISAGPEPYVHPEGANPIGRAVAEQIWNSRQEMMLGLQQSRLTKLEAQLGSTEPAPDSTGAETKGLELDVAGLATAQPDGRQAPQLAEMQLDRSSPEMATLRMFNQAELKPGQVVSFAEALPLREHTGVELGELGVVHDLHQGGINFDYARVELVGGRKVNVYQTDHVEPAPADITPAAVFEQPARADQRDPDGISNLPLANGAIVQRGDLVRFAETQAQGRVVEVSRSPSVPSSRGLVELEGGQRVPLYGATNAEIVKTAQEIAAEQLHQEQATIQGIEKQALRSGPKRAVGETEMEPAPEAEHTNRAANLSETPTQQEAKTERPTEIRHDALKRTEQQAREPQEAEPAASPQPAPERLREAAEAAYRQPEPSSPEQAPEPLSEPSQQGSAADAHRQLEHQAADRSAGRETPDHSPQPQAQPTPQMEASR
jgi:hypothetical protein